MNTTHLLITLKSPDEIGAAEAQRLLERALAWADIEAVAINDEGDPEAKDLADAMRWLDLVVRIEPTFMEHSPPCQRISDVIKAQDWPRRAGIDPNLVAPYGGSRVPADTLLDSHTDHFAAFLRQPKEVTMTKERLVVVHAQLAFAIPEGQSDDAVFDYANCLLIPNPRVFGDTKTGLIDYTFSDIYVSATPVDEVGKETGFKHEAESKLPAAS